MPPLRTLLIADYETEWAREFAALQTLLAAALGSLAPRIEHVGSTSVPGLAAKPILDVDVVIANEEVLPQVTARLEPLGYTHICDLGITGREAYRRAGSLVPYDGSGREWTPHHLYVCPADSPALREHIVFRNTLRADAALAAAYAVLKRDLARRFPHDIDSYVEGKTAFVRSVLAAHD